MNWMLRRPLYPTAMDAGDEGPWRCKECGTAVRGPGYRDPCKCLAPDRWGEDEGER